MVSIWDSNTIRNVDAKTNAMTSDVSSSNGDGMNPCKSHICYIYDFMIGYKYFSVPQETGSENGLAPFGVKPFSEPMQSWESMMFILHYDYTNIIFVHGASTVKSSDKHSSHYICKLWFGKVSMLYYHFRWSTSIKFSFYVRCKILINLSLSWLSIIH